MIRTIAIAPVVLALAACANQGGPSTSGFSLGALFDSSSSPALRPVADIGITQCDRLAGIGRDKARPTDVPAVEGDDLAAPAAIAACERALQEHPDHPRLLTQLGRSYAAAYRYDDALAAYQSAAEQGYAYALYMLGHYHQNGYGVPYDYDAAEAWYRKAGRSGQREAWNQLGFLYSDVRQPADLGQAISAYRRAAEAGMLVAMVNLSTILQRRDGWGDQSAAMTWARKAAEAGNAAGMRLMGDLHHFNEEYETAAQWYQRAADLNDPIGLHLTAAYLYYGNVGPEDKAGALMYYERAARAGYMPAAVKAAMMHAKGDGVPLDAQRAMSWLRFGAPKKIKVN